MSESVRLLVFTDLDSCLLDDNYKYSAAIPALSALHQSKTPLILNSSKTFAEMVQLADQLELNSALVAENGTVFAIHASSGLHVSSAQKCGDYSLIVDKMNHQRILDIACELRDKHDYAFEGFNDWTPEDVAERTGLDLQAAERAKKRLATEPILWNDSPERWTLFRQALAKHHVRTVKGGRFIHLMGHQDKVDGLRRLHRYYADTWPQTIWKTIALGDSENDLKMLEAADTAVVIPHSDGPRIRPANEYTIYATEPASSGWNQAVLRILSKDS